MVSQIKAWEPQADDRGSFADEAALVAGLRAGRQEAFAVLHGAYAASIYSLALRIVDDQHEAQDVAQEVLIKVFRGLPGDETDLNLPAWLYRVTVNAAFDHVRARKRRPVTVVDDVAPEPVAAVDEFERAELSRRVEYTLRELPKRQQVALVLARRARPERGGDRLGARPHEGVGRRASLPCAHRLSAGLPGGRRLSQRTLRHGGQSAGRRRRQG